MLGITNAIGALVALGVWVIKEFAAKWGYKVALIAAVVAVYSAAFAAILVLLAAAGSAIPSSPLPAFVIQFFPSSAAVASAVSLYYGTMATLRGWDYFKMVSGVAAKIAS